MHNSKSQGLFQSDGLVVGHRVKETDRVIGTDFSLTEFNLLDFAAFPSCVLCGQHLCRGPTS